jgi:hypothetical protein
MARGQYTVLMIGRFFPTMTNDIHLLRERHYIKPDCTATVQQNGYPVRRQAYVV